MKLKFILLFFFFIKSVLFFSQKKIDLVIHHDNKLLFIGDKRGNNAGTLDILIKVEVPLIRFPKSYVVIFPLIEYAQLNTGSLKRYGLGFGYIHRNVFFKKVNMGVFPNYGQIKRFSITTNSLGIDFEVSYPLSKRFSLSYVHQIIERTDLKARYQEKEYLRNSSFLGFKIHF